VVVEEFEMELEALVRRDLMEVIDAEFERIASIYREINKLCLDVDLVRVHPHIEVHDFGLVMDGLPVVRSVEFIFSGDKVVKIDSWRYDVVVVGDSHEHVIGIIEVVMFGDRCFIMKDVDKYELDGAVRDIVAYLKEGLQEGEV
jgi:DNA-binding NarL/FixJ family response regulator